ncbi:hypothetical protein J6590_035416 [Homalodisca vitripennis]|nr:hypothetical protein J6590_035416 [Homalodisca vitripennis]
MPEVTQVMVTEAARRKARMTSVQTRWPLGGDHRNAKGTYPPNHLPLVTPLPGHVLLRRQYALSPPSPTLIKRS